MKKIKIITFLLLMLSSSMAFAGGECKIKSGPSEKVAGYIDELNAALSGIRSNSKNSCSTGKGIINNPFEKSGDLVVKSTNDLTDFSSFTNGFKILQFVFDGSIPDPVYRDYTLLKSLNEKINGYVDDVSQKCSLNKKITSSTVGNFLLKYGNTNYENLSVSKIFEKIKKINNDVFSNYTSIVIGNEVNSDVPGMQELNDDMLYTYSPDAVDLSDCKQENGKKILDKLGELAKLGKSMSNGIKIWKQSFKLLFGGGSKEYAETEKQLLQEHLKKQGLKEDTIAKMTGNLERFNSCADILCNINDIGSRIYSSITYVTKQFSDMKNGVVKNAKGTQSYKKNTAKIEAQEKIQEELTIDKENLRKIMEMQDSSLSATLDILVDTHLNLKKIGEQMTNESIKASQELCNIQAAGAQGTTCNFK
ncbi:MAG: hypothetical protein PHS92_00525 [Candidatus Gracilibacteria bacterium]|nr:hypothetical protein [Candidatus Gracilibacteria bacterium]